MWWMGRLRDCRLQIAERRLHSQSTLCNLRWKELCMTTGSRPHPAPDLADVTSLLRLLAEASDSRGFFATLRQALPRVLPTTRVDLLAHDWPGGAHMALSGGANATPPDE